MMYFIQCTGYPIHSVKSLEELD